jgi:hypothetical protein
MSEEKSKPSLSSSPVVGGVGVGVGGGGGAGAAAAAAAGADNTTNISELLRAMTTKTTIETIISSTKTTTKATTISGEDDDIVAPTATTLVLSPSSSSSTTNEKSQPVIITVTPKPKPTPSPSSLPKTISRSYNVYKIPTHIFCQIFNDRIVLGVTQLNKSEGHIGSWVLCQSSKSEVNPKHTDYELSTLLGCSGSGNSTTTTTTSSSSNTHQVIIDEKEIYSRRVTERLLEKALVVPRGIDKLTLLLGISLLPINNNNNNNNKGTSSDFTFTSIERFKILVEVLVELIEETAKL